jgi:hypothetical protein
MAIRPEDEYINSNPADANYPEGSFKNSSTPIATDGSPLDKEWVNDLSGFLQKLIDLAGITPDGAADTVPDSEYFKSLSNAISIGEYADDSGVADAYVVDVGLDTVNTSTASTLLTGTITRFKTTNANTGACTINRNGLGVKNIKRPNGTNPVAGDIPANKISTVIYDGTNQILLSLVRKHGHGNDKNGGDLGSVKADDVTLDTNPGGTPDADTLYKGNVCKAWAVFSGSGSTVLLNSFNVSSVAYNAVGDYTINWDRNFANVNYAFSVNGRFDTGGSRGFAGARSVGSNPAVDSLRVYTANSAGTLADWELIVVEAWGDQ